MLDRTSPPVLREIESFKLPIPAKHLLSNGVELFVLNGNGLEVLKIDIVFDGGRCDEETKEVASFVAGLLKEGTSKYSSSEINGHLESHGAFIECSASMDKLVLSIYSLKNKLPQVLERITELLIDSVFPDEELNKYRANRLSRLSINLEKPGFHARREFLRVLYGESHPYGRISELSDLELVSRDDILKYYLNTIKDQRFNLFASGNIEDSEIEILNNTLGQLVLTNNKERKAFHYNYSPIRVEREMDRAVQSTLYIGSHLPGPKDENTHKISLVNEILGGYFGSRLMKNLREDKGYTYGMYSRVSHLAHGSHLSTSADVIKDSKHAAVEEVEKELKLMMNERVGEDELSVVKNYLLGTFLSSVNSAFSMMQLYRFLHSHDLPHTYFDHQVKEIRSTTSDEILELSRQYFNPSDMSWVVIG